ncbi:DUF397 domain-containing protein [Streptomyces sp. R08]|uniref:DUF397 domain-containing protein n=1 Tax=Streptomyces sp. R08 TaxID=3238624 RepID=A0AB39M8I6_9ACTN
MDGRPWPWRRASASDAAGNQCVEVQWTGYYVLVRDSTRPHGPRLSFHSDAWTHFLETARRPDTAS